MRCTLVCVYYVCVRVRNVENECVAYIGLFFIFLSKYDACLILLHVTTSICKRHQLLPFHRETSRKERRHFRGRTHRNVKPC